MFWRKLLLLDLRHQLIEGRADVPRVGSVVQLRTIPWYAVTDVDGKVVAPVVPYLRSLSLDDNRPATAKIYLRPAPLAPAAVFLDITWDRATEAEASALVGWLRTASSTTSTTRPGSAMWCSSIGFMTTATARGSGAVHPHARRVGQDVYVYVHALPT
ncbi:hypothetical protein WKI68_37410 [Streptomyces sp. MS1.HAVA.3]|uniref:Uncharacterized protein n=1 Tax=Streptomyces caledonius TaxID=3134107 RepID=A0ABU8UBU6_9ACTN